MQVPERHSRVGGDPVFERLSGCPSKSGMTLCDFHQIVVGRNIKNLLLLRKIDGCDVSPHHYSNGEEAQ